MYIYIQPVAHGIELCMRYQQIIIHWDTYMVDRLKFNEQCTVHLTVDICPTIRVNYNSNSQFLESTCWATD